MTPAILWMRHGTCDDGLCLPAAHARPDSPLTIGGIVEAELAAHELRKRRWQPGLIVSSTLLRARQTASVVARTLGVDLAQPTAAFAEWQAPYCVLGRTPAQYPPEYVAWREQRTYQADAALPGGESLGAFAHRAGEARAIASDLATQNGPVLVVSHRLLIGAVAALGLGHQQPTDIFGFASGFRIGPAHLWVPPQGEPR
jgi:probable phosphoglycerate mutase